MERVLNSRERPVFSLEGPKEFSDPGLAVEPSAMGIARNTGLGGEGFSPEKVQGPKDLRVAGQFWEKSSLELAQGP